MCMWYYGCYPFWARRWITLLDSNNRNRSCSVWEMKRLPGMRAELSVRGCALLLTGACGGWAGEVRASWLDCFSAIGGSEIWCSKKNPKKKPTWLVAPVTAVFAPSTDHVLMQEVMPCCAVLWSNLCYWCFFEQPNEKTERFGVYNGRLLRTSHDKSIRQGWFYEGSNHQDSNYLENTEKEILIAKKTLGIGFILSLSLLIHRQLHI